MKGLLTKDLLLMAAQRRSMIIIVLMGAVMSLSFDASVIVLYLGILGTILAVGTLSYDEYDNGYPFLFTLPVSRKTYVREKYMISLAGAAVFTVIGLAVSFIMSAVRGSAGVEDILPTAAGALGAGIVMVSFIIPLRLKYGSEKSRIALYVLYALFAAIIFAGSKFLEGSGLKEPVMNYLVHTGPGAVIAGIAVFTLILLIGSERVSERILEKKEY